MGGAKRTGTRKSGSWSVVVRHVGLWCGLVVGSSVLVGCVPRSRYERLMNETSTLRAEVARLSRVLRDREGGGEEVEPSSRPSHPAIPPEPPEGACERSERGLTVCIMRRGEGHEAVPGRGVVMEYTGWLPDGKVFDSSLRRQAPFRYPFKSGKVIRGWEEGLEGMREGGQRLLVIPPDLAYGAQGHPPTIPPDATLTFLVDLVRVE